MPLPFKKFPFFATLILLALVVRLIVSGLSAWGVAGLIIAVVWFALEFVKWLLPPGPREKSDRNSASRAPIETSENLISLVFFLDEARQADTSSIRNCVSNALGIKFELGNPDAEFFVMPFSPPVTGRAKEDEIQHFMVKIPAGLFAVLVSNRPYIENPKGFAKDAIRDKRLRNAVEKHVAWISVDLMEDKVEQARIGKAYRVIGKILASMGGPDCLAIYCPELQRCNEFDPGLLETLCGEDPVSLFNEPTFEPVIEISDNNPKMAAAVKEAVARWPEFVAAYEKASFEQKERFIAKAEFREGRKSEYMWVTVLDITQETVSGILMNDPHELLNFHRGAAVSFGISRLNDWIYPAPDSGHIGGFTLDVLADSGEE